MHDNKEKSVQSWVQYVHAQKTCMTPEYVAKAMQEIFGRADVESVGYLSKRASCFSSVNPAVMEQFDVRNGIDFHMVLGLKQAFPTNVILPVHRRWRCCARLEHFWVTPISCFVRCWSQHAL